jgi:hypothetical protein
MIAVISEIEKGIYDIVNGVAIKSAGFSDIHLGTPQTFLTRDDNEVPCILVSYTGADPYQNMYPGVMVFSVYYISHPKDRITIYKLMENVFDTMQYAPLENLNGELRWQSDRFFYEDVNYLIFVQQWTCDKVKE